MMFNMVKNNFVQQQVASSEVAVAVPETLTSGFDFIEQYHGQGEPSL